MDSEDQYAVLRSRAGIVDRSERGRLVVTGNDRRSYLQGLLTNDIEALRAGQGCYAAYLTAQGRMIADMHVFETGDAILIDVEGDVTGVVRDRLTQFVFSEDVQVADVSTSTVQFGVYGPDAAAVVDAARGYARYVMARDDFGPAGFDFVADAARSADLHGALQRAGAVDVGARAVEMVRVEAGRPRFGVDMDEDTIPLEAGIEDRAISRTKGCYVGQEIIIRVLDRGHGRVARRLVGLIFEENAAPPPPGDPIRAGERDIGRVTSAVESPAVRRAIALGYVHRDFAEPGTVVSVGKESATVTALPFV